MGIFYNCHLKEDILYTITLKKICGNDIPDVFHIYYKTNAVFDKDDCSRFKAIVKNTNYVYDRNYGKYVDMDGILYEIVGLTPGDGCVFQH